jgi:hypothetical protein
MIPCSKNARFDLLGEQNVLMQERMADAQRAISSEA